METQTIMLIAYGIGMITLIIIGVLYLYNQYEVIDCLEHDNNRKSVHIHLLKEKLYDPLKNLEQYAQQNIN